MIPRRIPPCTLIVDLTAFTLGLILLLLSARALAVTTLFDGSSIGAWVASTDPYGRGPDRPDVARDFLDVFDPNAPWIKAGEHVAVFKFGWSFLDLAPMDVLRGAFTDLARRGIATAWEMGAIPKDTNCGHGEGYAGDTARTLARIKAAGGTIDYIAMDEPLWFGHHLDTRDSCHFSIAVLADKVARQLSLVRQNFPNIQVGDIEPVGVSMAEDYPEMVKAWADALQRATGHCLAFFHADIAWDGPWRQQLPPVIAALSERGIRIGAIINGDPVATTDIGWTEAAISHLQQLTDLARITPASLIFQTWDDRPTRMLPDSLPGSLMNLVLEGTRPPSLITLSARAHLLKGHITNRSGIPIPNTSVTITAFDDAGLYGLHTAHLNGTVPPGAVQALFALRVNIECDCKGQTEIDISTLKYSVAGHDDVVLTLQHSQEHIHLTVGRDSQVSINSDAFSVLAGAPYTASIPILVRESEEKAGYVALIFLDDHGKEIRRDKLPLKAPTMTMMTIRSDPSGDFFIRLTNGADLTKLRIRAEASASSESRATLAELLPMKPL